MRISHEHRFVFLSKPKCASVAVRNALDPFSDITSTTGPPWTHHVPLADLMREFARRDWDWESYFVFTTVRNPYTMLNSLYAYGKPDMSGLMWADRFRDDVAEGRDPPLAQRVPPDPVPFREWVLTHHLASYALDRFIKDDAGRVCVDDVLRVEILQEEFARVADRLGLAPAPRVKLTNRGEPYAPHPFDLRMRERVREVFRTDFEVGGYELNPSRPTDRSESLARSRVPFRRFREGFSRDAT